MNRRALLTLTLTTTAAALAGCQSLPLEARDQAVALALLGPIEEPSMQPSGFALGAGDALGQDIFVVYVASIMDEQGPVYATGEDGAPSQD